MIEIFYDVFISFELYKDPKIIFGLFGEDFISRFKVIIDLFVSYFRKPY